MNETMTRQQLFARAAAGLGRLFGRAASDQAPERNAAGAAMVGLGADFPDEMLHAEARRLGLDPARLDRERMLAAVAKALSEPGGSDKRSPEVF